MADPLPELDHEMTEIAPRANSRITSRRGRLAEARERARAWRTGG